MIERIAQPGDLCILLEPARAESDALLAYQQELQGAFGGLVMQPVHLTCQRFDLNGASLAELRRELQRSAEVVELIGLRALRLLSVFSPYRQLHVLKWEIEVTPALRSFSQSLVRLLDSLGTRSLYGEGFQSTWVTALEGIQDGVNPARSLDHTFPRHLFYAHRLEVSRINGPFEFETVDQIVLNPYDSQAPHLP